MIADSAINANAIPIGPRRMLKRKRDYDTTEAAAFLNACMDKTANKTQTITSQKGHSGHKLQGWEKCIACGARFTIKRSFDRHVFDCKNLHGKVCLLCKGIFRYPSLYDEHKYACRQHHIADSNWPCKLCKLGFESDFSYYGHLPMCKKRHADVEAEKIKAERLTGSEMLVDVGMEGEKTSENKIVHPHRVKKESNIA